MQDITRRAISAALNCDWEEAISLNQRLLQNTPEDIDVLNRLSKAHFELRDIKKARKVNKLVLSKDPQNNIALKNSAKFELKGDTKNINSQIQDCTDQFLEIPGKTKIIALINLTVDEIIIALNPGERLELAMSEHRVCINCRGGKYVGRFPDDIAKKIIRQSKSGNEFEVLAKTVSVVRVTVFIRTI